MRPFEVLNLKCESLIRLPDGLEPLANTVPTAATGIDADDLRRAFVRSLILGTSNEGYISLCSVIAEAKQPDYGSIKVPLLILAGSDDKTAPLSSSEAIAKAYGTDESQKKVHVLNGVGHWHCIEDAEGVANVATHFIQGI